MNADAPGSVADTAAAPAKALTPLMQQYHELKARFPHEILLFRLGDFYEMFHEDAQKAAPILEVALTHRQQVPMCGVPAHAVDPYVAKLLRSGLRVAIADQLEDPATTKGIVKRDVVRVMTPGTLQEDALLPSRSCNFLVAVTQRGGAAGVAAIECSTGEFIATEIPEGTPASALWDEIIRLNPSEVILETSDSATALKEQLVRQGIAVAALTPSDFAPAIAEDRLKRLFGTGSLRGFGLEQKTLAVSAAGAAVRYLENTQCGRPFTVQTLRTYAIDQTLQLDAATLTHLDLVGTVRTEGRARTLLDILDQTLTPMGSRLMRRWLVSPLRDVAAIKERQRFVEFHAEAKDTRRHLRTSLQGCPDFERILTRLTAGTVAPRDLAALGQGLRRAEKIRTSLAAAYERRAAMGLEEPAAFQAALVDFPVETGLANLLERAINEAPPATMKDGGVVRDGYHTELDEVRTWIRDGKTKLLELEKREREQTGISSLKVAFNNVFGYYIEVTKTHLARVPAHYTRKQTTANGERYITPELKEFESRVLGAEERSVRLETAIVQEVREKVLGRAAALRRLALAVAELDVYLTLADVAERRRWTKPRIDESDTLVIREGRHPVLEEVLPAGTLVPNDVSLNGTDRQITILTGPNMSGKSTYLRQTALIVILAQMGAYVPAAEAQVGVVDHLFTRIGASDRLADGESTFMVEMVETARILNHATERSLVILDEVGRGTSTYDGMSIAWACLEYLHGAGKGGPKVLFATHYFELTQLAQLKNGIQNAHVTAREWNDQVIFLHKVEPGPADRAYGIHVARLAGVPKEVLDGAAVLLEQFERKGAEAKPAAAKPAQGWLFNDAPAAKTPLPAPAPATAESQNATLLSRELQELDLNQTTPLQALLKLQDWKDRFAAKKENGRS